MSPNVSLPSLQMKLTLPARRAAATAWFDPFPPGPIRKDDPRMVWPQAGADFERNARSATKLPAMVIRLSGTWHPPVPRSITPFFTNLHPWYESFSRPSRSPQVAVGGPVEGRSARGNSVPTKPAFACRLFLVLFTERDLS